jgi:hypothetical protein
MSVVPADHGQYMSPARGHRIMAGAVRRGGEWILFAPLRAREETRESVERIEDILRTSPVDGKSAAAIATPAWHAAEIRQRLDVLGAHSGGLSSEAARDRLRQNGPNALPPIGARSRLAILVEQFQSSPVLILAAAAA